MTLKIVSDGPATAWSLRHPALAGILLGVMIVAGLVGFSRLHAGLPPQLAYPQLRIQVHDPGVPAMIMDQRVASPLLRDVASLSGPRDVRSTSSEGNTSIVLYFDSVPGRNRIIPQLKAILSRDSASLPSSADPPVVVKGAAFGSPRIEILLTAPGRPLAELRHWTEGTLLAQFLGLPGVAGAHVDGGPLREIQVVPDQRRLAGLGLALDDVVAAVRASEAQAPHGNLVTAAGAAAAAVGALPVRLASGDTLSLSEVARVREMENDAGPIIRFDGTPAVRLLLKEEPGTDPIAVTETIKAHLAWLHANGLIPGDIQARLIAPQSQSLEHMLRRFDWLVGVSLVLVFVLGLALGGSLRESVFQLVVALASLSVSGVFFAMAGMTLNVFSLTGMVVAAGLAVAAPLAAQESAIAFASVSQTASRAAARAALDIVMPPIVALLLLLAVPGVIGLLGLDLAAVIVVMLLLSAILTGTVLRGWLLHGSRLILRARRRRRGGAGLPGGHYRNWLSAAMKRPLIPAAVAAIAVSAAIFYGRYLIAHAAFLPLPATNAIRVQLAATGKTPERRLDDAVPIIEQLVRAQGDVNRIVTVQDAPPAASAELHVELNRRMQRADQNRRWIARFDKAVLRAQPRDISVRATVSAFPGAPSDFGEDPLLRATDNWIGVRISGADREVLASIDERIAGILRNVTDVRDVHFAADSLTRDFVLHMDPALAAERGVDEAQAARAVRIARGGLVAGRVLDGDERLDIRVTLPRIAGEAAVPARLLLRGETRSHPPVYLNDVASVERVREADDVSRNNEEPMVAVNAVLSTNRSTGRIVAEIEQRTGKLPLPQGYHLSFTGVAAGIDSEKNAIMRFALLGSPLFALALVLRYRGWRRPLVVLLSAPFAFAGSVAALGLSGQAWSLPAWIGAILAIGTAAGTTTFLLDLIDLRLPAGRRGAALVSAVVKAAPGVLRLSAAAVSGPLLLVLFGAPELALLRPLAMTLAGGALAAAAASLLFTPLLYRAVLAKRVTPGRATGRLP